MSYYSSLRPLLFQIPPETAHNLAITALKTGLLPPSASIDSPTLHQTLFGLTFLNPVGLAAGFDKNAEAVSGLRNQGFGFLELGTVTPKAQPGNPKPRMFRLVCDEAVINRLGFNNKGLEVYCHNLQKAVYSLPEPGKTQSGERSEAGSNHPLRKNSIPLGANIGKNKATENAVEDYLTCLEAVSPYADYITINISSPNTAGLRDLQGRDALASLLDALITKRASLPRQVPLLLKIAPDLTMRDKEDIAEVVLEKAIDGLIVSNTTTERPLNLQSRQRKEKGGLSGKPLFHPSTQVLAELYKLTQGKIPLIGVGGISSGVDAYQKIRAGASLVQLYSALVYQGFGLIKEINRDLVGLLAKDGFTSITEAIGIEAR